MLLLFKPYLKKNEKYVEDSENKWTLLLSAGSPHEKIKE